MYLDKKIKADLENILAVISKKVNILFFTQEIECRYCRETRDILTELSEVSDKLELHIKNFVLDKEDADKYSVDKIPATIILDENFSDYDIKFYGIPSGYEFSSLVESIKMLGTGESGLPEELAEEVKKIKEEVHLQVFVTPTCPYCPQSVIAAHRFAFINPNVRSEMIEATGFPHLSQKYNVKGVPRMVINEKDFIEGAVPEEIILEKINQYLLKKTKQL